MNKNLRILWLALIFTLLPALSASGQDPKNFHWNGKIAVDQTVTVKTINGEIRAEPSSSGDIEVTAEASGTHAQEVNFEVRPDSNGVTICENYPGHNSCDGNSTGHHGEDHTHISYQVRVPAVNRFAGKSVNGSIKADNLDRQVTAKTVNGAVRVTTKSWAEADSVNGSVEAMMGDANWTGTLRISSVNGTVHVGLPADANADIDVRTVNGSFKSDFPVVAQSFMSHHIQGRVGSGGRELKLETVNGSVHLTKTGL